MSRSLEDRKQPVAAHVYDIANCGPNNRFVANGKLVHNSGGDKLNLQNLPARGDNTIRRALRAPDGHVLIACDSSQIEARMVGYLAGQDDLTKSFAQGVDVYSEFAADIYSIPITSVTKQQRFVGKTSILGLGYGMGHVKFRDVLKTQGGVVVNTAEAKWVVNLYRNKYHKISTLWRHCNNVLGDMCAGRAGMIGDLVSYDGDGIVLPNGLKIRYTMLQSMQGDKGVGYEYINDARVFRKALKNRVLQGQAGDIAYTKIYGGKVAENIVQALARIVVSEQMVAVGRRYHVLFQVHDELIICVPKEEEAEAKAYMMKCMSTAPKWAPTLPVACEADSGPNYGSCK